MSVLPPFPGLPPTQSIENLPAPQMQLSRLPNGLRVASQETYGQLCNFGLFIDAGSRIETKNTTGTTQLMELMAFKSTCVAPTQAAQARRPACPCPARRCLPCPAFARARAPSFPSSSLPRYAIHPTSRALRAGRPHRRYRRSHEQMHMDIAEMGGSTMSFATRDLILYNIEVLRESLEPAMELLAETVLIPRLLDEEVEEMKMVMELQVCAMTLATAAAPPRRPVPLDHLPRVPPLPDQTEQLPPEVLLKEAIHEAAFGATGALGQPHYCPPEAVSNLCPRMLSEHRAQFYQTPRMVLVGAGVDHDEFLALSDRSLPPRASPRPSTRARARAPSRLHTPARSPPSAPPPAYRPFLVADTSAQFLRERTLPARRSPAHTSAAKRGYSVSWR